MTVKHALMPSLAFGLLGLSGCDQQAATSTEPHTETPPLASIGLSNPSSFARSDEPYYLSFYELGLSSQAAQSQSLGVQLDGTPIPSQLIDRNADGQADGLLSLVDIAPGESKTLSVVANQPEVPSVKRTQAEISQKTGGQWQEDPENPGKHIYRGGHFENVTQLTPPPQHSDHSHFIRYEGPGIESDKIGYRVYLDWRNGFDIFGKKTREMVLQDVGQDGFDSYHEPADWGLDILKVGDSVGSGGYGFWNGHAVQRVSEVDGWDVSIFNNGPLYSSFSIQYKNWTLDETSLDLTAQLSMHAGSRLVHVNLALSQPLDNMAIGLVKHPGTELIEGDVDITGKAYTYVASWGEQAITGERLGMALLFRKGDRIKQTQDEHNYVILMDTAGNDLDYYFLGAWEAEPDGITNHDEFVAYLEKEVEKLTLPLRERVNTSHSMSQKKKNYTAEDALSWSKRLAGSELDRKTLDYHAGGWDLHRERKPKFEYDIVGLVPMAYDELHKVSPDDRYQQVVPKVTGSFVDEQGAIARYKTSNYNIDNILPGRNLLRLYKRTGEEKYKLAADRLRHQLEEHPKTSEGAFWHKKRYPWQLWLDGVYMGMPFLAQYSQMFEDYASLDQVVTEFEITRKRLRDPQTGLYYHGWDEKRQQDWADPETGLSSEFWGRGVGWFAMALVDTLDYIPEDKTAYRQPLIDMTRDLAQTLKRYQDESTGLWWQIMDKPEKTGNYLESSASSMFTYFFAKALNQGYIDAGYRDLAQQAYNGLVNEFITVNADNSVSLTNICLVAGLGFGRDGSYDYYMSEPVYKNDPKGTGPFILAGVEMFKLLDQN